MDTDAVDDATGEVADGGSEAQLWPSSEDFVSWVETTISALESLDVDNNMHWCPQWWDHPEAVDRLRALHLQQLVAMPTRDDPAGSLSSWWVDHWDRHAVVLFGRTGPFGQCRDGHVRREPLELDTPPEDLQL